MKFTVVCSDFNAIKEIQDFWTPQKFRELMESMEYPDITSIPVDEIKEMCLMALTDNEPWESAEVVLAYVFKNRLNKGQIANLSHEIVEDRVWEEYANLSMHEDLFNVTQLLYEAYNGIFPKPEAVRFNVRVTSQKPEHLLCLKSDTEASLIRILVQGMPQNTIIGRLFDEQVIGGAFPEARDIIWQYVLEDFGSGIGFSLISSAYWFKDIKYVTTFTAKVFDM